jgi:choline dehydrogenase-like flavoprotein
MSERPRFDTVIMGAGASGYVLANRLARNPDREVLPPDS